MKMLNEEQRQSFHRAKSLMEFYKNISLEHAEPTLNQSVVAGDLIADIQFAMSYVYEYPIADIESIRIAALNSLKSY